MWCSKNHFVGMESVCCLSIGIYSRYVDAPLRARNPRWLGRFLRRRRGHTTNRISVIDRTSRAASLPHIRWDDISDCEPKSDLCLNLVIQMRYKVPISLRPGDKWPRL